MQRCRLPFRKLLQNWVDGLPGLELLIFQRLVSPRLGLIRATLHLLEFISFYRVKVDELPFIVLDKELECS